MMDITNSYEAYCFDTAVSEFGNSLVAEMDSVEGKTAAQIEGRRRAVLMKAFGQMPKFRTPQATVKKNDSNA